jgi:hypothetical protein
VGPGVSEVRGKAEIPFRVEAVLGRGHFGGWAEMAPPSPFLIFVLKPFLFSVFLISFLEFA